MKFIFDCALFILIFFGIKLIAIKSGWLSFPVIIFGVAGLIAYIGFLYEYNHEKS